MSDLLNQASLVMVPSGYKEDVVYSQIPTDGSGDLAFTRASNGTRVNSAGLVEDCPWNLIDNSNSFTSGAWILQEVTSTSGQSDPLGGNFGWRFNETTATGQHRFYYAFIAFNTGVVTQSIYVKSLGRDQIFIGANSNSESLIFTFSTETISSVTGFTSTSATSVGGGWYRLTATFLGFSPINCLFVQGYNGGLSYAGDTSKGFYAFGGQLNIGSTAKPYFPTTDRLNVPRLTYQNGGGGCPSLLLEKQSTNLVLYSDQLDNAVHYNLGFTIAPNNITSPDGTQNADKFTETTATGEHVVYDIDSNATGIYTLSAFFKGGAGTIYPVLRLNGSSATAYAGCIFNTSTGAVVNTFYNTYSAPITKVENMGNGWYRVSMTTTTTDTNFGLRIAASNSTSPSVGAYGAIEYTGSTSNYFYAWGAQLEASSYPTSYIPTTSSSATRVEDAIAKFNISSLIGQSEGTMFADVNFFQTGSQYDTPIVLTASGGAGNGYVVIDRYPNKTIVCEYYNGGSIAKIISSTTYNEGRLKIAFGYKQNDFVAYVNGVQIGTDTSGNTALTITNLYMPYTPNASSVGINEAILFPTRLTNSELASLTTI